MYVTYVGIDNGVSGAVAIINQDTQVRVYLTPTRKIGADTRIDAKTLVAILRCYDDLRIVYEQGQKQPTFGVKGNFANGRSDGVLETVCELLGAPYRPVNPKDWQKDIFQGIRGAADNTKDAAIEFCRRTFPGVSLLASPRCSVPNPNMADALCMAYWAKTKAFPA